MNNLTISVLLGAGLVLVQLLAALPWVALAFLSRADLRSLIRQPLQRWVLKQLAVALAICVGLPVLFLTFVQDTGSLEIAGRLYAAFLQTQLTVDLFIFLFALVLKLWPKGGAVALAAFLEGVRQWPFWMLTLLAALLMTMSLFIPYFTFGEDYLMFKQLGYDIIMLAAVIFGTLAASLSISEEIEGRTAITVMSKPVSRRQFMLGKYLGILLAALFMFGVLGAFFEGGLLVKHWWEKLEPIYDIEPSRVVSSGPWIGVTRTPAWVIQTLDHWGLPSQSTDLLRGLGQWIAHSLDTLPGLVLCFSQVMVLVGLAVALATRIPMAVNLTTILVVYVLSNLTPVLVMIGDRGKAAQPNAMVPQLVGFVAGVFNTVLPDLGAFRMDPALLSDAAPPPMLFAQYVGSVTLYGIVYTAIVLLFGLILFEDRDLA
jgi:hypothetical protein